MAISKLVADGMLNVGNTISSWVLELPYQVGWERDGERRRERERERERDTHTDRERRKRDRDRREREERQRETGGYR